MNRTAFILGVTAIFGISQSGPVAAAPPAPAPAPIGPYSPAVGAGDLVFLSGQVARDPATGKLDPSLPVEAQTAMVWANIRRVLDQQGLDFEDLVQAQVYLIDMIDFARMNIAYAAALGGSRPARTTVAVSALPLGARIEIAVIASRTKQR